MNGRVDPRSWAAPKPPLLHRLVPITTWLPGYDYRRLLRFDVIAGVTVWGLLVPEMIAYSGLAGLPPQAGLYTLLATLAAYAVFGTSRHVVVAGTSAAAVLLASTVGDLALNHDDYLANSAALVLFVGGLFLLAGVCRLGFIAQFLSRPVVAGFVFGLAIFVTVKQLPKLLGIEGGEGDTLRQLAHVITHLGDTSGATLAVGACALVLLFGVERFVPKVPGGLVALVAGIVISGALDLASHGVAIVGKVPSGLPSVGVPDVPSENIPALMAAAAGMLLVIYSESLGAAQNFATKYDYEIDPNQELIALGVANAGSGFVGGLAAGGSLSQSAVNEGAGAKSEASSKRRSGPRPCQVPGRREQPASESSRPRGRRDRRSRHHERRNPRAARYPAESGRHRLRSRRHPPTHDQAAPTNRAIEGRPGGQGLPDRRRGGGRAQ